MTAATWDNEGESSRVRVAALDDAPPPHDLEAERALLSAAMVDPEALGRVEFLKPAHFYAEAHRRIYEACVSLRGDGRPVDSVQVASWLRDRGRLAQVGGMPYLAQVLLAAPAVANVAAYGATVLEAWRRRELIVTGRNIALRGHHGGSADEAIAYARRELATVESSRWPAEQKSSTRPLVEVAREMATAGPRVRLDTGIATLDEAMRGGFPVPWLAVLGGAPGAGKTSLALFLANRWARAGIFVGVLAVDEGPEGAVMRLAQMAGFKAARLDDADPGEWELALEHLAALPILIADGDDGATLETVARDVRARAGDGPAVLIADSIQTVRAAGTDDADGPRARADRVVAAMKVVTRDHGLLTLATCELARGSYQSKSAAEQINDLAAFKESGSIEYAAQTAIVLRSLADEEGLIDAAVPKNRAHRKLPFRMRMDHRTASLVEVPIELERPSTDPFADGAQAKADATLVERLVLEAPGVAGMTGLRALVRSKGHKLGNVRLDAAVAYLGLSSPASPIESARLEDRPDRGRPRWFIRSVWSVATEEQACAQ